MNERPWTEEERAVLMDLAQAGSTATQVAARLNRSKGSVLGFAHRQFGGFSVVKPIKLKPLHVPKKVQKGRKDGLSPTGRSTKSLPPEILDTVMPKFEALPDVKPKRMFKVGRFECKYIVSEIPKDPNPWMCGAPVKGTGSWCPYHHSRVFNPLPPKRKL